MRAGYCYGCMEHITAYPCPKCGYFPTHDTAAYALRPGTILNGKYLVGKVLGQGGFGITYIGLDLQLQRRIAIKEYYPTGHVGRKNGTSHVIWYSGEASQEAMRYGQEIVLKEARKTSKVSSIPAVVQVYNVFQENGTAYICMDFVRGQTLLDRLKASGPLSWEDAKDIFLPIISAMGQVHRMGLIHRDLSPDNLMIQPDGYVKILDLGAAKDLNLNTGLSSMQVAKNGFSPLEQYMQSGSSGTWTDVYAMAATMYYALTGVLPPCALDRTEDDTIQWNLPQLAALPPSALAALKHAMAVRYTERTKTMEDFLKELTGAKKPGTKPPKWLIPALTAAAAAVAVTAVVFGIASGNKSPNPEGDNPRPGIFTPDEPSAAVSGDLKEQVDALMAACTMETYDYRNGARMELYFDSQDNECLRIFTNQDGKDEFIILAEYDADGNMLEQRCYDGQDLARSTVWTRNGDGNPTRIQKYKDSGTLYEQTDISYDSKGREISRTTVNGNGDITTQGSSTYDSQGRETYSRTNERGEHIVSLYSSDGDILESTTTDKNGRQTNRTVYRYDGEGRNTEYLSYDENDQLSFRIEYHFRGDLETGYTSHSYYNGEEYTYEYEYIFGPRDIQFGEISTSDTSVTDTEYVRDITHNGNVLSFTYRQASYSTSVYDVYHYDWSWDLLYSEGFDEDGNLVNRSETLFDEEGKDIGSRNYNYRADGTYTVSENDENYRSLSYKEYNSDGTLISSTEYRYDANGESNGQIRQEYNTDGSYTQTEVDKDYHTTMSMTFDSSGTLISKAEYSYDSEGKRTGSILTTYYFDGSYTVIKKDGSGNTLSELTYDADGNPIG